MSRTYLRGEIYYADLDPVVGSEQMGTRPVLILQNNVGNHFARTVIVAPITSRIHTKSKIPTHSNIGMIGRMKYPSVVMLEQLRTLDKRRIGYYIGKLPEEKMQDVTRALCVSLAIRPNTSKAPYDAQDQRTYLHGLQRNGLPEGEAARAVHPQDLSGEMCCLWRQGKNYRSFGLTLRTARRLVFHDVPLPQPIPWLCAQDGGRSMREASSIRPIACGVPRRRP